MNNNDRYNQLEKITELKEKGILTEKEYECWIENGYVFKTVDFFDLHEIIPANGGLGYKSKFEKD